MSDSEDYYFELDSDMEENQINELLAQKMAQEEDDNLLAYTAQRMFHGGGTPPNASDKPTIPQMQVLFQQPKILGVKCPIRSASNLAREKRNEESKKFNEFFETLTKETYTLEELTTKYNEHFPEAFIEPRALSQMKCIKKFFISIHKQKRLKGQSKKIDFRLYQKRKF
mgnify:FL=1